MATVINISAAQTAVTTAQARVAIAQTRVATAQAEIARLTAAMRISLITRQRILLSRALGVARANLLQAQQELRLATTAVTTAQATLTRLQAAAATASTVVTAPAVTGPSGLVRALCVGINYRGTGSELYGCINDATDMAAQLRKFFPSLGEARLLTDDTESKPTKANILAGINWLVSGLTAGQNVVFHFSGHGGRVRDTNGDEVTGLDSCLYASGMATITDDEIRSALAVRIPAGCKCLVILDCCHSGTAVDLRYRWQAPMATRLTYTEAVAYPKTAGSVLFLSGCRDTEYAMDTVGKDDRPCGAMTMALLDTWRTYGPAIKLKYLLWDVQKYLKDNGYSQVPQLETGLFQDMNVTWNLGSA